MIKQINAGIDQCHFGREFHVGGIHHISKQRKVILITVLHHGVVLVGQLHLFLLCLHLGVGGQQIGIACLYAVLHPFTCQGEGFLRLLMLHPCFADLVFILPKIAKAEFYTNPDEPHVDIAIFRNKVLRIWAKELILSH